jgi:hypothetical protein
MAEIPTIRLAGLVENYQISAEINPVIKRWVSDLSIELDLQPSLQNLLQIRLEQTNQPSYLWLYLVFEEIRGSLKRTEICSIASLTKSPNPSMKLTSIS